MWSDKNRLLPFFTRDGNQDIFIRAWIFIINPDVGLVCLLLPRITSESWILPIVAVLVGGIVYHLCNALLLVIQFGGYDFVTDLIAVALPEMLVVVIPALPVFLILRWVRSIRRGELPLDVY